MPDFNNDPEDSGFSLQKDRSSKLLRRMFKPSEIIRCSVIETVDDETVMVLTPRLTYRYVRKPANVYVTYGTQVSVFNPGGQSSGKLLEMINVSPDASSPAGVSAINSLQGEVSVYGSGVITVTEDGNDIIISSEASGGGTDYEAGLGIAIGTGVISANLVAGDNITLTDLGGNALEINSSAGGGGGTNTRHGASASLSGYVGIPTASATVIDWVVSNDTDSYETANPGEFKVPTGLAGVYVISVTAQWDEANSTGIRSLIIVAAGNTVARTDFAAADYSTPNFQAHIVMPLDVNDVVYIQTYQNSGTTLDYYGRFNMYRISD